MEFEHLSSTTNSGWGSSTRWTRSCNSHGSGWKDFHHKFWDYWEFFREFFPHQRWKWNSNRIRNIESIGIDKRISKSRTWRSQLFILRGMKNISKLYFFKSHFSLWFHIFFFSEFQGKWWWKSKVQCLPTLGNFARILPPTLCFKCHVEQFLHYAIYILSFISHSTMVWEDLKTKKVIFSLYIA